MASDLRLVAPFRPFPPESQSHKVMSDFNWIDAIQMLSHSAEVACGVPVQIITDVDTKLPVSCLKYQTERRRLMLWTLEACLRYLESPDFDRDTVMLDCDQLIYQDLRPFFRPDVDLTLLIRPTLKHSNTWKKLLNGVQFWSVAGKARLISFYRQVIKVADHLPEEQITWGGDTIAIRNIVEPVTIGIVRRVGAVVRFLDYAQVLEALTEEQITDITHGGTIRPRRAVMDFRYQRKRYMRRVYELTMPRPVLS